MRWIISLLLFSLAALAQDPADARAWIDKGAQEFKSVRYREAIESFQKAVELNPNDATAHLYLASAWLSREHATASENLENTKKAEAHLREALQLEPRNAAALEFLASLLYQQAQQLTDPEQKNSEAGGSSVTIREGNRSGSLE